MNNKIKIGISLLIALAFIIPSGAILAERSTVDVTEAAETINYDKFYPTDDVIGQDGEHITSTGIYFKDGDEEAFRVEPNDVVPVTDCYTILMELTESGGGGDVLPHFELYEVTDGIDVTMYETSFEDNFDIYNNWVQIDEDCSLGGYFDSFSWSDARASDGDHSMKSTMYDIYKGNQDDYLECLKDFDITDQNGVKVSFDVWVDGQGADPCDPATIYDYLSFEIGDDCGNWDLYVPEIDPDGAPYWFFDTTLPLYDYGCDLTESVEDLGGGWWRVHFEETTTALEAAGLDTEKIRFRFDWHTDPQFQYEGAYVDNFKVISVEDVENKIFQTHAQNCFDFVGNTMPAYFEFPLEWCDVEPGDYKILYWNEPCEGDSVEHGVDDKVEIPFTVGDEIDCEITDIIIDDSFTGEIVPDGGYMTQGSDAHIQFEYHHNGNVPGVDIPVKVTGSPLVWETVYETDFEGLAWTETGNNGDNPGGNLWHKTDFDSFSGSNALGWFNADTHHYENDVYVNYVMCPKTLNMEGVEEMYIDFYAKWILEKGEDQWGIMIADSAGTGYVLGNLNGAGGGRDPGFGGMYYQPDWIGPMQPAGKYQSYDLKAAYDYWVDAGAFRDATGEQVYDVGFAFVFWETDGEGYVNEQAEANGEYWSGLMIDDVSVRQKVVSDPVFEDEMIIPGPLEDCDTYNAQFEWEDVPYSHYQICVETMCEDDIDEDNNKLCQTIIVADDLERATDKLVESIDLTGDGAGEWGICGSDTDNYLSTNANSEEYAANMDTSAVLCPGDLECTDCIGHAAIPVDHLANIDLSFEAWWDIEDGWDFCYLEYAFMPDAGTELTSLDWNNLDTWTGLSSADPLADDDNWVPESYSIPVTDNFFALRFRMNSDPYTQTRGMLIDDLVIVDLFDVTEITDPAPVYEDFEDTMDTMDNWCNDIYRQGQFWEYTGTEWCNEVPVGLPINDALVWETEIADAYQAWLTIEHDYVFQDLITVFSENFDTGLGGFTVTDNSGSGCTWGAYPTGYYIWHPPVEGGVSGPGYAGAESFGFTGPVNTTMTSPSIDISAYNLVDLEYTLAMLTWNGGTVDYSVDLYSGGSLFETLDAGQLTSGGTWFPPSLFEFEIDVLALPDPTDVQIVFEFSDAIATPDTMIVVDSIEMFIGGPTPTGYIEISADGGDTWYVLDELYNEVSGGYVTDTYDISAWAGNDILIRARVDATDEQAAIVPINWCIDEMTIMGKEDTTAPTSSITMSGTMADAGWYSTPVQVTITATDDNEVKEIHYILDGSETVVAGDTASFTVSENGAHDLEFWAVDGVGNVETPHNTVPTFRIDSGSPPTVAITAPEPGLYLFGNKLLSLSKVMIIGAFTAEATASDAESGVYRVQFLLDGDVVSEDTEAPFNAYIAEKHMGAGTLSVVAEDFSGNTAEDSLDITYYKFL